MKLKDIAEGRVKQAYMDGTYVRSTAKGAQPGITNHQRALDVLAVRSRTPVQKVKELWDYHADNTSPTLANRWAVVNAKVHAALGLPVNS